MQQRKIRPPIFRPRCQPKKTRPRYDSSLAEQAFRRFPGMVSAHCGLLGATQTPKKKTYYEEDHDQPCYRRGAARHRAAFSQKTPKDRKAAQRPAPARPRASPLPAAANPLRAASEGAALPPRAAANIVTEIEASGAENAVASVAAPPCAVASARACAANEAASTFVSAAAAIATDIGVVTALTCMPAVAAPSSSRSTTTAKR